MIIIIQIGLSSYFTGLTNLASTVAKGKTPSYIEVDCFDKNNFNEEFAKCYKIDKDKIVLEEENTTINDILSGWLNDKEVVDSLQYWIGLKIGKPLKVYKNKEENNLEELISGYSNSMSPFYITEEVYFVEYNDYILCLMIGNNE